MADEKKLPEETTPAVDESSVLEESSAETAAAKPDSKADASAKKDKKKGRSGRFAKYFRDLKGEFKKIIWPTFPAVVRNTLVTLGMCAFVGVIVALIDLGLSALVNLMLSL